MGNLSKPKEECKLVRAARVEINSLNDESGLLEFIRRTLSVLTEAQSKLAAIRIDKHEESIL